MAAKGPTRRRTSARGTPPLDAAAMFLLAGHDLQQPLQSLRLLARLLGSEIDDASRRASALRLDQLASSMDRMLDLLAVAARLDSGASPPTSKACGLMSYASSVTARLMPVASRARVELSCEGQDLSVRTDPELLELAIEGVVLYAVKFGTGTKIAIATKRYGQATGVLEISFEGPDPAMALERQAFVELTPLADRPVDSVLGPGLALVSLLAHHMGAQVGQSRPRSGGRRVWLRLPLVQAASRRSAG